MVGPWWEVWAERLDYELEALRAANIPAELDRDVLERGVVKIEFRYTTPDGHVLPMYAIFPDLYPYFRFQIYAPTLNLPHHQNPIGKNLCLLGRDTRNWVPSDTLAAFVRDRLPDVLRAGAAENREEVADLEEHQAEPVSDFYHYVDEAALLIDSSWVIEATVPGGELVLGFQHEPRVAAAPLRGAVLQVLDPRGTVLAEAEAAWSGLYPYKTRGRWLRTDAAVLKKSPEEILTALQEKHRQFAILSGRRLGAVSVGVLAVLFPEERAWGELGTGWIFLAAMADKWHRNMKPSIVRASRAGPADLSARRPEMSALEGKRIAVVGLGGLGAPSTLELARAGVAELRLVDDDILEAGTAVRWPLGVHEAGRAKSDALKGFIEAHYPYTAVRAYRHRLGAEGGRPRSDLDVLREVIDGIDLIYDASAEHGVQHFLSAFSRNVGVTCVSVSTTLGAWGGTVLRIRPGDATGCAVCLEYHQIDKAIAVPPENPTGVVQPVGCAAPTYTGSGVDVSYVALAGVRLAVATLLEGVMPAYVVAWDVAIISLRDGAGRIISPTWTTAPLTRHPQCPHHG